MKKILIIPLIVISQFVFSQNVKTCYLSNGILNLQKSSFENNIFEITGNANFYKELFLLPNNIHKATPDCQQNMKHSWNNQKIKDNNYPIKFYGTYHFKILLNKNQVGKQFILRPNHFISYASEVFVNGITVCNNGKVGISKTDTNYSPSRKTNWRSFSADSTVLDIVVWVANFNHFKGGIFNTFSLGLSENMISKREQTVTIDLVVIVSLLLMFIYHIILFFIHPRDKISLFFSLTCLIFAFDFSLQDTMTFFIFFPKMSFELSSFIHTILPYLLPSSFIFFLYALFPKETSLKFRNFTALVSISLIIITFLSSNAYTIYLYKPHYLYMLLVVFYVYYAAVKAVINKRPDAILFLIAYLIFSACAINDILLVFEVINSVSMVAAGLILFVFMLSILQGKNAVNLYKNNLKLANDLQKANTNLEKKVVIRTKELNVSLKKVKEYSKFKEEMSEMLVHDLKTPLNTILNLPKSLSSSKRNEIRSYSAQKMLNLVLNILDVNKYKEAELKIYPKKIAISKLFNRVVLQQNYAINQKNISIKNTDKYEAFVMADVELTERILSNLLSNALKYTANNGQIILTSQVLENSFLKICISDNGSGIPIDKLENIFNMYSQSGTKIKHSTGIGLTFCKIAVEQHGGEIAIESEEGKGTTVCFTLPASKIKSELKRETIMTEKIELLLKEKQELSEFIPIFEELDLSQITAFRKVFKEIENKYSINKMWLHKFKNSVYHCNEEEYDNLINEIKE